MKINKEAFTRFMSERGWSLPKLADELDIDYSYLFRIINGQKGGGSKLFSAVYAFCAREGLRFEDYIFLSNPLSVNKDRAALDTGTDGG